MFNQAFIGLLAIVLTASTFGGTISIMGANAPAEQEVLVA